MLPWNYGFEWSAGTVIFMGAFYLALTIVAVTLMFAAWRSVKALRAKRAEAIRWRSDFHDLPPDARACRHTLTGRFRDRQCPNCFECGCCETNAALQQLNPQPAPPNGVEETMGMSFPLDRLYHRGHTWVRPEADGTVVIGLDDLGSRILGKPDEVALPKPGEHLTLNGAAWRARKRNADVRILSPVDGEVVETGGPESEWMLKVKPDASEHPHLLRGAEIKPWVTRELERLHLALAAEGAAPTLADGGVPVADIAAAYPEADWDAVCGEMFLHP